MRLGDSNPDWQRMQKKNGVLAYQQKTERTCTEINKEKKKKKAIIKKKKKKKT
jgi:hypothetical protein